MSSRKLENYCVIINVTILLVFIFLETSAYWAILSQETHGLSIGIFINSQGRLLVEKESILLT